MNYAFTVVKKSLILNGDSLEIYYAGFIQTKEQYDAIEFSATNYLFQEGFLEDRVTGIDNIFIFDYASKQVNRESLAV